MSIYSFQASLSNGQKVSLKRYKDNILLIVNTASECGLTSQYESLEKLYRTYKENGFTVLAFPCDQFGGQEPGTNEEIRSFCSKNYNVTFPLFEKIEVNGEGAHPLYQYLREQASEDTNLDKKSRLYNHLQKNVPELLEGSLIRWNFTKFLVDKKGNVVKRYSPTVEPEELEEDIKILL
ncbi:glutathione peroxidase [Alteribacillus persepolensis]|uniref:Glutathione peroxidase n=1 Tax=Alteribacillus persepolensis TaxID=568899 RepID=A0A1G8HR14_9BACI|nr:glutathione peroxidase [Alteribacillus persepolensis]SDI09116.1 glutathione peroxidase [Alteribacillus persepolensis]